MSAPQFERSIHWEHGANRCRFVLKGEHGATQFLFRTGWQRELGFDLCDSLIVGARDFMRPCGVDRGYHWWGEGGPEYGTEMECDISPTGKCSYDGSGLAGAALFRVFVEQGEDAVWAALEADYVEYDRAPSSLTREQG